VAIQSVKTEIFLYPISQTSDWKNVLSLNSVKPFWLLTGDGGTPDSSQFFESGD